MSDQSMTPRWSSLMVPIANFVVEFRTAMVVKDLKEALTISVASTRVPTIFSRTRVFLSII